MPELTSEVIQEVIENFKQYHVGEVVICLNNITYDKLKKALDIPPSNSLDKLHGCEIHILSTFPDDYIRIMSQDEIDLLDGLQRIGDYYKMLKILNGLK